MGKSNVMLGFGKALASLILAIIAIYVCMFSMGLSMLSATENNPKLIVCIMVFAMTFIFCIISFSMGISSISTFKHCRGNNGKPIPALILGIHTVVIFALHVYLLLINVLIMFTDFYTKLI